MLVLIEAETQTRQEARPAPDYEAGNLAGPALKLGINNNKQRQRQQQQLWQLFGGPGLQPAAQRPANATRREVKRGETRLATSCNKLPHRRGICNCNAKLEQKPKLKLKLVLVLLLQMMLGPARGHRTVAFYDFVWQRLPLCLRNRCTSHQKTRPQSNTRNT